MTLGPLNNNFQPLCAFYEKNIWTFLKTAGKGSGGIRSSGNVLWYGQFRSTVGCLRSYFFLPTPFKDILIFKKLFYHSLAGNYLFFFLNIASKVALSRPILNPGLSYSQPDAMTTWPRLCHLSSRFHHKQFVNMVWTLI